MQQAPAWAPPPGAALGKGLGHDAHTVLPDHSAVRCPIRRASRWQRQVTSWGWGQAPWGWGWASVPSSESHLGLQGEESGSDCPRVVAWGGESLVDLVSAAPLSQGAVQDRSTGTPLEGPSLLLQPRKSSPKESKVLGSEHWEEPRPPGSQAGCLSTGAVPLQLRGSPATLGFCFLPGSGQSGSDACGAGTGVLLLARGPGGLGYGSGM